MAKRHRRKQRLKARLFLTMCVIVLVAAIALISFIAVKIVNSANPPKDKSESSAVSKNEETKFKETEARILSTGDIMVHSTQLEGAYVPESNSYDFSAFFKETAPYFKDADLSVANLEVTFGGNEGRKYAGYPGFNTPDSLADVMKDAGLNLLVTSNNHSYDTGLSGLKRTAQVLKQKGIEFTGTKETENDPSYIVKSINNIKVGIVNYTYETSPENPLPGRKYLNGNILSEEANNLINSFDYNKIDAFYSDIGSKLTAMEKEGAEFTILYIHWGNEYQTSPNTHQKAIAQKLCNMGVDVIIGSHPHVIQPVSILTSEDSTHNTVCFYSTGNAISNQRQELMDSCPSGHTEDGMLIDLTLKKTKDGVFIKNLGLIPTWVDKYRGGSGYQYTIYPIENPNDLGKYSFNSTVLSKAQKSYERTKAIVAEGLTVCQQSIGCEITFK